MPQSLALIFPHKRVACLTYQGVRFPLPQKSDSNPHPSDLLHRLNEVQMADQMGVRPITPLKPLAFQRAPRLLPLTTGFNLQVHIAKDGRSARLDFVRSYHTGMDDELVTVASCRIGTDTPNTLRLLTDVFHHLGLANPHHAQERDVIPQRAHTPKTRTF